MSDKLATLLWSGAANSLCGIALGDDFDRLQLPDWWKDEHSNGNVRSGWFTVSEHGVEHAICRVTQVFGRVSRVDVSLELANAAAEQPTFDDLVKRWQERLGITGEKQGRKSVGWRNIAGAYASDVEVRLASFDSDEEGTISRVEVVLGLAVGINIKASVSSLFVDIDGVADVLSSNAFPREVVKDFCGSFFAYANYWAVPNDDRERMFAIQRAVAAERPDRLRALARQLLSLATFADLKYGESLQAHYLLVGVFHFSVNNSSTGKKPPPRWTKTNLRDICALLAHLDVSASERTAWAQTISRSRRRRGNRCS